ncbi:MAG: pyruvate dehydrogenase (acetyl-transferring) E1 component subunit alpha [Armatimonadota bacterium]|nr:pyruvate dehydrogenase (acetyl-transferring) E1 component subunit alpha [bacterium]
MLAKQDKIDIYHEMAMIRKFEERASEMYEQGKIRGFLHLYIGQEAVASGFMWPLRPDDYVIGAYREHGQALGRCATPRRVMAELFGKSTGVSSGKGGSMHLFDVDRRFLGGTAIVGGGLPLATGIAFSINYKGGDQICLCFFGDGAVNEGAFHEALNIASLWNLPILFVCENNLYGMGTAVERASAVPNLYRRAQCYSMDVETVDGMDVLAVHELADRLIKQVRNEKRPAFVEAVTYRFRGHSVADPGTYRSKEEIEDWRRRDPIVQFGNTLLREGTLTPEDIEKIQDDVAREIDEAVQFAEDSPFPKPEALYQDVYA